MSRGLDGLRGVEGRSPAHPRGFTLLELLVALSILGLLMAGLFYSLGSSASLAHRLRDRFERQYDVRLALRRLAADLEAAYLPPGERSALFSGERSIQPAGTAGRLEFLTFLSPWEQDEEGGDLALVGYALRPEPERGGNLLVREWKAWGTARPEDEPRTAVVLEGVKELILQFLDREGRESVDWPPGLASGKGSSMPAAVRVTLVLERGQEGPQRFSTLLPIPAGFQPARIASTGGEQEKSGGGSSSPPEGTGK